MIPILFLQNEILSLRSAFLFRPHLDEGCKHLSRKYLKILPQIKYLTHFSRLLTVPYRSQISHEIWNGTGNYDKMYSKRKCAKPDRYIDMRSIIIVPTQSVCHRYRLRENRAEKWRCRTTPAEAKWIINQAYNRKNHKHTDREQQMRKSSDHWLLHVSEPIPHYCN